MTQSRHLAVVVDLLPFSLTVVRGMAPDEFHVPSPASHHLTRAKPAIEGTEQD